MNIFYLLLILYSNFIKSKQISPKLKKENIE